MKIIEFGILDKNMLSYDEQVDIIGGTCYLDVCGAHACGTDNCSINVCGARACGANFVTFCTAWAWIWSPEDPNHPDSDENSLVQP